MNMIEALTNERAEVDSFDQSEVRKLWLVKFAHCAVSCKSTRQQDWFYQFQFDQDKIFN